MKLTIEQTVAAVKNAPSSIFTKDDVLNLFNNLEPAKGGELEPSVINRLVEVVIQQVQKNADNLETDDVCDVDSAEFDLNGDRISLSSVDVNCDGIGEAVVDGVIDEIEAFFENLKSDEDSES